MGLLAEFTMDDLGYAESTEELGIFIDYSEGCEVFAETFLEVAQDLVPVDTGYLMGSINASATSDGCTCITECEYAEYVEYGTCYMGAQPYFEPAIEAAREAATPYWDEAVERAMEEEAQLLAEMEKMEKSAKASRGGRNPLFHIQAKSFAGMMGHFLGVAIGALIVGFFNLLLGGGSHHSGGSGCSFSRGSRGSDNLKGSADIEVEII